MPKEMNFKINNEMLFSIIITDVEFDTKIESSTAQEFTMNCGCGGRCLSSTT